MNEEVEVKTDATEDTELVDEDEEMAHAIMTTDSLIPLQQQLTQIDQHYPPPARPIQPESFHSVGQKRRRLNELESTVSVKSAQQTAATLYRDALHSIYQFLNLKEFVRTCVINHTYYSAGQQMKSRHDKLYYRRPVYLLVQSPLRHHITELVLQEQCTDPSSLLLVQMTMAHLSELQINLTLTKDDLVKYSAPICFAIPKQLRVFDLCIRFWDGCNLTNEEDARNYLSGCMKQIALQSTHLAKLSVFIAPDCSGELDCPKEELQTITTLTDLELPSQFNFEQVIDLIKDMPSLRIWQPSNSLSTEFIQRLVDGLSGPSLLEDIGLLEEGPELVDDAMAEQLIRLVNLTRLDIILTLTDPTKLLPHFPRLSILILACQESVNVDYLVLALSACVSLTDLNLSHPELTSQHFAQFLSHLHSLVKLELSDCGSLVSLEFLTTAARVSLGNLRTFTIDASPQIPINEYHHLRSIASSLESLTIEWSSMGHFDPLTIGRWTPGSKEFSRQEWPKLKSFSLCQITDS